MEGRGADSMAVTTPQRIDLQRFVEAQDPVFDTVCAELRAGRKSSHWMWFIFPQLKGLGRSAESERFAIDSLAEADAYLRHPILGPRLRTATALVNAIQGRSIHDILGAPDDRKFRSSMTLFSRATRENGVFLEALRKYYAGEPDPITVQLLCHPKSGR
jgi:uncharacterized protein (DUF1810 family)